MGDPEKILSEITGWKKIMNSSKQTPDQAVKTCACGKGALYDYVNKEWVCSICKRIENKGDILELSLQSM